MATERSRPSSNEHEEDRGLGAVGRGESFGRMSAESLLSFCRDLYAKGGFEALTYASMQRDHAGLYMGLYFRGITKVNLIDRLGLTEEFVRHEAQRPKVYAGKVRVPWTWERAVAVATELAEKHGHVPSAPWFARHKLGSIVHFVYRSGRSWEDLRKEVGDREGGRFVESRNGLRWLSHAEASLSNFLYARGIEHRKGERYPNDFADVSDARYAIYDMHFCAANGQWMDVDVWGDNPMGQQPEKYARRREHKEAFNRDNPRFLGIPHKTCYDDALLQTFLEPHIGVIEPFVFDKPTDPVIPTTHWSNADELLAWCRVLAANAPGGVFPAEDWLRKRGRWADRPGEAYSTLSVYIKQWLGGTRNLRRLLEQEHASTLQWDKERALREYKRFFDEHGRTPGQVTGEAYGKQPRVSVDASVVADAVRVSTAVEKYVGGALEAQRQLGMTPSRNYWTKESADAAFREFSTQHGITPSQAAGRWTMRTPDALPAEVSLYALRVTNAYRKHVGPIPRGATVEDFRAVPSGTQDKG